MKNESGYRPCGRAVLVKPYAPAVKRGLIEVPDEFLSREQMLEQRATVIQIGPRCWYDEGEPRCAVGDRVLISRYAGYQADGFDGNMYRLVNDKDIFAVIEGEEHE